MSKITKKVEKLRAFLTTKKQVDATIENLQDVDTFNDEDKLTMESFKRVFHRGVSQVKVFLEDLDKYGPKLDEYSIMYYIKQIFSSPFTAEVAKYIQEKKPKYWIYSPDIMAVTANLNRSDTQTPMLKSLELEAEVFNDSVVTLTKIPEHVLDNNRMLELNTNSILALSFLGSFQEDNLLKDKSLSYIATNDEPHGSYMVADTTSYEHTKQAAPQILEKLKEYLGEEDYRMYEFKKSINPFAKSNNTSTKIDILKRKTPYIEKDEKKYAIIETDIAGRVFESDKVREFDIKISTPSKDKKLKLHTVEGQLGSGVEIKKNPISS